MTSLNTSPAMFPASNHPLVQTRHGSPQPPVHSTRKARPLTAQAPFDGLGDVPFFTYITFHIDDRTELKVNVANGNLIVHTSDLHIHGTGIDESVEGYYNSQAVTVNSDHGNNWNFSVGHDLRLDISNPSNGITLHGPSGYAAFFPPNGTNAWTDAPGLNATLTFNTSTQGRTTTFTHNTVSGWTDPTGELTKLTDPASRTVKYGYGERGNPANSFTTLTDTLGKTTLFDYSGADITAVTDPLSNVTQVSYLTGDKVHQITDATGHTLTFTYNSGTTVVQDRNGNNTTYTYNTLLQVTAVKDALNHTRTTSYDANYDVSQYQDSLSDLSVFTFSTDGKNNLDSVSIGKNGVGPTSSFGYPSSGNNLYYPQSSTDAQGNPTTFAYDNNGNLTSATNTKTSGKVQYFYNANGTVSKSIDPDNNVTLFGYDTNDYNLTSVTPQSPLGGETLTYFPSNPLSRVKCVTDGNNVQTCYQYDALDRVTRISYNGTGTISYVYDAESNLLSETDNTGTTSFTYDSLNRIKTKTLPGGTVLKTDYDPNGNLLHFTDGSGKTTYGYDAANNMLTLTEPDGTSVTHYVYDSENRKVVIQYPSANGTGMTMAYNSSGQLTAMVGGVMNSQQQITTAYSSFTYTYTQGSTPTSLVQTVDLLDPINWQSGTIYHRVYSYDGQNRLTDAVVTPSGGGPTLQAWTYQYDAAGNRTQSTVFAPATTTTYSYPAQGANELASVTQGGNTTTYAYDGMGNLTSVTPGNTLTYNNKNQTKTNGSDSYTYSGPDQRDRVQVNSDTFVYSGLGLSSQKDSGGTTYYSRCSCGLLNHETLPNGKKYYYLFDGLMSIVGLTGPISGGSISKANLYDYNPYGVILSQTEFVTNPWKFAGGYLDGGTGLYKFGVRYYNPELGRWTQQDPVGGSLGDLNSIDRYVYAGDDPVNAVDPSGKDAVSCSAAIAGALGGGFLLDYQLAPFIFAAFAAGPLGIAAAILLGLAAVAVNYSALIGAVYTFCQ